MPKRKVFMIVTNDEYEMPVFCDIVGKQAVADFIGISITQFSRCLKADRWIGDYKVIDLGFDDEQGEFEPNTKITALSFEDRKKNIDAYRDKKHKASIEKTIQSRKAYEETHREEIKQRSIDYYWKHREERCEYGKRKRREIKMLKSIEII